jgi:glyoxylase-like metal-dependent hydrolase (beta-lactamase superfamily II)
MPDAASPPASPRLVPGVPSALSPLVRRIVAPNPGPFTGPGTNTYLVGIDEVAVIDPGPDDEQHIDAIIGASMKERVRWVVLTHTHPDHAPGTARLVKATGAEVLAYGKRLDKDNTITPDRAIGEGDTIEGTEFGLDVLHTPGDTVLDGMFSVVSPQRGGDMAQYLESLGRMEKLRLSRLAPGHGDVIEDARPRIQEYVAHRHDRERQVLTLLKQQGPAKIPDMVTTLYADRELHPKLVEAAGWQLHAHLLKLKAEGKVTGSSVRSAWSLA